MTVEEILTVGIETATGIMNTVTMTETITNHVAIMTREAGAVRVPGLGKDQEIMIAEGNLRKQSYYFTGCILNIYVLTMLQTP